MIKCMFEQDQSASNRKIHLFNEISIKRKNYRSGYVLGNTYIGEEY